MLGKFRKDLSDKNYFIPEEYLEEFDDFIFEMRFLPSSDEKDNLMDEFFFSFSEFQLVNDFTEYLVDAEIDE